MPTTTDRPRDSRGRFIATRPTPPPDGAQIAEDTPARLPDRYPAGFAVTDSFPRVLAPTWHDVHMRARDYGPMVATDSIGRQWVRHPESNYDSRFSIMIRDTDEPEWEIPLSRARGVSRFACPRYCLHNDGCSACNPSLWRRCYSCYGEDAFRSPVNGPCNCWATCDDCADSAPPRDVQVTYLGDGSQATLCDSCYDGYGHCNECSYSYRIEDGHDCPGVCDCPACQGEGGRYGGVIRSYSYKPDPEFHGDGPVYMGLELEVSTEDADKANLAIARHVQKRFGDLAYLKSDGSISQGFEIVTHPMSYQWGMANFPWGVLSDLRDFGVDNSDECGLHIHVNRDGFSGPLHTYRWMKFIYRNRTMVQRVARRHSDEWAPFRADHQAWLIHHAKCGVNAFSAASLYRPGEATSTWANRRTARRVWYADRKIAQHGSPAPERYAAINPTNEATLEVRVFAGSVHAEDVKAAMALVAGSIEYTRQLTAHDILSGGGWTWDAFITWAQGQGDTWAPLTEYNY